MTQTETIERRSASAEAAIYFFGSLSFEGETTRERVEVDYIVAYEEQIEFPQLTSAQKRDLDTLLKGANTEIQERFVEAAKMFADSPHWVESESSSHPPSAIGNVVVVWHRGVRNLTMPKSECAGFVEYMSTSARNMHANFYKNVKAFADRHKLSLNADAARLHVSDSLRSQFVL